MKFLQSLFKWDTGASAVEKFMTVAVVLLAGICLIILFGSCWGLFNNDISRAARTATSFDKIMGAVLLCAAIFWAWWNWTDRVPFKINDTAATILLALLIVFSALFRVGFYAGSY